MSEGKVVSLNGGPTGVREVNEDLVEALRRALEAAESGEYVGGAMCFLVFDTAVQMEMAGKVGGYSLLGGINVLRDDLSDIVRGE